MFLPLVKEFRRGLGLTTFMITGLRQRVADLNKTTIVTQAPKGLRGYEEMLLKNGFARAVDNFFKNNKVLDKAVREFITDTNWTIMVTVFEPKLDYLNSGKKLKKAEKMVEALMKAQRKKQDDNIRNKHHIKKPAILKWRPGTVFEGMLRHGLDNVLILYVHCWCTVDMSVKDFGKAFKTAM